jgi:acyl-CoA synthetase (AMP-forming)/AMP-acid ligase II
MTNTKANSMPENRFLKAIVDRIDAAPSELFCEVWAGADRRRITWGDLGDRARTFGATYRRHGAEPGDVIFLMLKHSADLYPAFLGAMLVGAVPSFLPFPSAKQDASSFWSSQIAVFRRTGARLLLTYAELAPEIARRTADMDFQVMSKDDIAAADANLEVEYPAEDALALLQHSSGTTGLKKGVMLTYRAIFEQVMAYSDALGWRVDQSVIASWLPLYHDMGLVACFLTPMLLGVPIISLDAFEWTTRPASLLEAIESRRATHAWLPNFALAHIARATPRTRRFDLGSLQAIIGCSEPNKPATVDQFVARFADEGVRAEHLRTCYAMAETVFAVTQSAVARPPRRLRAELDGAAVKVSDGPGAQTFLSNGRPIADMEVRVLHDGRLSGEGVTGEICVRAPYLFEGYLKDPATTQAAFIDGFFKTGDLGFIHEGEVYIFGRIKELIIVNGRNYFAHDVEMAANEAEGVKKGRCVAFGVYAPSIGSEQIILVAEREAEPVTDSRVVRAISEALNLRFGTTAGDIRLVEPGWLLKTTSGKISRAENALKYKTCFRPDAQILTMTENRS